MQKKSATVYFISIFYLVSPLYRFNDDTPNDHPPSMAPVSLM
jgi:hypothetical protein